jgi:uncharacterized phage-associated protein
MKVDPMASVHDVAAFILKATGPVTAMKLQKLVYYAQAWSLVLRDKSLVDEEIQAWTYGPVCPDLYQQHRGQFTVSVLPRGDATKLASDERVFLEKIVSCYGKFDGFKLSQMTHSEDPWIDARRDSSFAAVITDASMRERILRIPKTSIRNGSLRYVPQNGGRALTKE